MNLSFVQGIVTYPSAGTVQQFLTYNNQYVSIATSDGRTDLAFAQGTVNYLVTESVDVPNAWGPIPSTGDVWIYWNLDLRTAVRTFGYTVVQPTFGPTAPSSPVQDQHWFNTTTNLMYWYNNNAWRNVIRLFAAKVNTGVFYPLGAGFPSKPFAGTQVGVFNNEATAGRILIDNVGYPIVNTLGQFFTTESDIFVNGSPVNVIRLEANVLLATAVAPIAAFQIASYTAFGSVSVASYNDIQSTAIVMCMEDIDTGAVGTMCVQGHIINPQWNWTSAGVGATLWCDGTGNLVAVDPHLTDPVTFPTSKQPIARVISAVSVFFDQGLGGKGDQGIQGVSGSQVPATPTQLGTSLLSVTATDPVNPIVVGDNDPRNTNARTPLAHTQAATTITVTPVGILVGPTVQDNMAVIAATFVNKTGDTVTGYINVPLPTSPANIANKQYVDAVTLASLPDTGIAAPTIGQILQYNGTKWVNIAPTYAGTTTQNTFTASQTVAPTAISTTNGQVLTLDLTTTNNFDILKNGTLTINLPVSTQIPDGIHITLMIKNIQSLWCPITLDSRFKFSSGFIPTWDLSLNAINKITGYYFKADDVLLCEGSVSIQ